MVGGERAAGAVIVALVAAALGYGGWQLAGPEADPEAGPDGDIAGVEAPDAETPDPDTSASESSDDASDSAPETVADAAPDEAPETVPETPEPPEATAPEPPVFDVVRVDADGNALIAGRAMPNAEVSVLLDGVEVSKTPAGSDGNFVSMFSVPPADVPRVMSLEMQSEGEDKIPSSATVILQPAPNGAAPEVAGPPEVAGLPEADEADPDADTPDADVAEAPAPDGTAPSSDDVAEAPVPDDIAGASVPDDVAEAPVSGDSTPTGDAPEFAGSPDAAEPPAQDGETADVADPDAPEATELAEADMSGDDPAAATEDGAGDSDLVGTVARGLAVGAGAAADAVVDGLTGMTDAVPDGTDSDTETADGADPSEGDADAVDTAQESDAPDGDAAPVETAEDADAPGTDTAPVETVEAPETPELDAPEAVAAGEGPVVPDAGEAPDVPAAPSVLLADDTGIRVLQSGGAETRPNPTVEIDTITYDPEGEVAVGGRGGSGGFVRLYLDNRPIKTTEIGVDGQWTMDLPDIDTGLYTLRVDELDADGEVVSRVETPFKREEPELLAALETARNEDAAGGGDGTASAPRPELLTVQPGNTLWGIASTRYGDGMLYVRVFEANKERIRDPHWIYPGQVFAIPE